MCCVFLSFKALNEVKLSRDFSRLIISQRQTLGALEPNEGSPEGQKRPGGAGQEGGCVNKALSP
jgi:hypothetical protein